MLTRRELAVLAAATAAARFPGCGGEDDDWQDVAALEDVPTGDFMSAPLVFAPDKGDLGRLMLSLTREGDSVLALSQRCTHRGCPVRYVTTHRFICPCHGAVYDARGKPVGGPTRGPLDRFNTRVVDGRVQVELFSEH